MIICYRQVHCKQAKREIDSIESHTQSSAFYGSISILDNIRSVSTQCILPAWASRIRLTTFWDFVTTEIGQNIQRISKCIVSSASSECYPSYLFFLSNQEDVVQFYNNNGKYTRLSSYAISSNVLSPDDNIRGTSRNELYSTTRFSNKNPTSRLVLVKA